MMIRFLLANILISFSAVSLAIEVSLQSKVVLDQKTYTLSDIAKVSGRSVGQLGSIVIGSSPRPGAKVYLGVDQIKSRLYRVRPSLVDSIQWQGANAVQIVASGKKLAIEKVVSSSDAALTQWSEEQQFLDYDFVLTKTPNEILLPRTGKLSFSARVANNTGRTYRRMSVWVDVLVGGEHYHSYQLWYRFAATKTAYIATLPLSKSTLLDKGMFEQAVVDATQVSGLPVSDLTSVVNKRLRSGLSSGEVVTFNVLEVAPLVVKGQTVKVDVNLGGIGIQTKAIALKNGHLEETIDVLNPVTKDSYLAIVVDRNKVRVE